MLLEGRWAGVWDNFEMSIKEGPCCNEHRVFYETDESLDFTPETNNIV